MVDGITFDSKRESERYTVLVMKQRQGEIAGLQVQPAYPLVVNGVKIGVYKADFCYALPDGTAVTEDVKSKPTMTPVYRLKKKLVRALWGVEITEVA